MRGRARSRAAWLGVASLIATAACSVAMGLDDYAEVGRCTGPLCGTCPAERETCGSVCCAVGNRCADPKTAVCVPRCSEGLSACGLTCCARGQFCLGAEGLARRCGPCDDPAKECGQACCSEGASCIDRERGVCAATWSLAREHQSCDGLAACAEGRGCCERIAVPAATFPMGRGVDAGDACPVGLLCESSETPEHPARVSSFSLDAFEVTVGRFRRFVERWNHTAPPPGAGAHPRIAGSGWRSLWDSRLPADRARFESLLEKGCATERLPIRPAWGQRDLYGDIAMNCVNWYEAFAFCVWDGGRLPTEAEWERAAANGAANDPFPWGAERAAPSRALFGCLPDAGLACALIDLTTVGTHPDGKSKTAPGHHDLAGNVSEWTLDAVDTYPSGAVDDGASVGDEGARITRGGSFASEESALRAAARGLNVSSGRSTATGFRCARTP